MFRSTAFPALDGAYISGQLLLYYYCCYSLSFAYLVLSYCCLLSNCCFFEYKVRSNTQPYACTVNQTAEKIV